MAKRPALKETAFDYIVVGAGSAGATVAARLSEDPDVSVLVLEAGGTHKHWSVTVPMAAVANIVLKARNWGFETVPQKGLNGRRGYQPRGRMLGGSSGSNAMIYIRGVPEDYDNWAAMGADGWDYASVLPYFLKSEHREAGANDYHAQGGPLNVAPVRSPAEINDIFIAAARELQLPINDDFNGATQEGIGLYEVTQKNGERWSTARAFLDPAADRDNLTILSHALTEKVIVENDRATGVQVAVGKGRRKQRVTFTARREVILSGGAFGSPQLLLLSGIGAKDRLEPHGIEQVADVPGVGENLHDHIDVTLCYKAKMDDLLAMSVTAGPKMLKDGLEYRKHRTGLFTTNYAESGGFLYTDRSEPSPDIQLHMVRAIVDDHGRKLHYGAGYSCHVCVLRPKSRGTLQLASADPADAPLIDPAFLEDERDVETLMRGVKTLQRILQAPAFDAVDKTPLYAAESESDAEILEDIRNRADTVYHPVGTCKMGDLDADPFAVVDPRLRVRGVAGLRVIDASVMPQVVSGNTNAPSIMIGEKGADMIKQDWAERGEVLAAE